MRLRISLSGERSTSAPAELWERFEAVGMIRGEFPLRSSGDYFTVSAARDYQAAYVEEIAALFSPRPVWYRTTDFWSTEANPLRGIDQIIHEDNPIVGVRGLRRGLMLPEMLETEVKIISSVAQTYKNLHLLLPFVGDAAEFSRVTEILGKAGWPNRVGCMLEIPSAVLDVKGLVAAGATNLMLGLNDLTCLLTGAARNTDAASKLHPSVWWCVDYVGSQVGSSVEWGIAGSLTKSILQRAEEHNVPYASLHYAEVPDLLDLDKEQMSELGLVRQIKLTTRARAAEFAKRQQEKS